MQSDDRANYPTYRHVTRRGVLRAAAALALAVITGTRVSDPFVKESFIIYRGWVLKRSDLPRFGANDFRF